MQGQLESCGCGVHPHLPLFAVSARARAFPGPQSGPGLSCSDKLVSLLASGLSLTKEGGHSLTESPGSKAGLQGILRRQKVNTLKRKGEIKCMFRHS